MGLENKTTQEVVFSVVQVTDRCNFDCDHCIEKRANHDMTSDKFRNVLDWLNNPVFKNIVIYGGEVRIHPQLKELIKLAKERNLKVEIYTNGFGMSNPEKTADIIDNLSSLGVDTLAISTDKDHRDYAVKKGIKIDYEFLKKLFNLMKQKEIKHEVGIRGDISIHSSGNDDYAIPVGNARNFSWKRRLESGTWGYDLGLARKIKRKIKKEFTNWADVEDFSHTCYCYPAKFVRRSDKKENKDPKVSWAPHINTDMTVTTCPFDVIPRLCSVTEKSAEEAFMQAKSNRLYRIIAYEGPQGVARLVWNLSEDKLREQFIERTPCGLCEDLAISNCNDLQEMINTDK
jgi:MoaA/NifB/PqqE/SkfB family radical SAM enzyme